MPITWRAISSPMTCDAASEARRSASATPSVATTRANTSRVISSRTMRAASGSEAAARISPSIGWRARGSILQHAEDETGDALADGVAIAAEDDRHNAGGIEGQLHHGDEELLLGAEEVRDERRIDAGLGGDRAQ